MTENYESGMEKTGAPTRDEVVAVYRALKAEGRDYYETSDNPTGKKAQELYDQWFAGIQKETDSTKDPVSRAKNMIAIATVWIDAGYEDPDEIEGVLDGLSQELEQARESGNQEAISLLDAKIKDLESKLPE